jgi:protease-4
MSMVGSIGVTGSYIEFGGTLNRYNATYRRLVSGKYKDMGSPLKQMTDEEEALMYELLDDIREEFIDSVVRGRNLSEDDVPYISDGQVFTGRKAMKLGLVDELGGKEEAVKWIERKEGITAELARYEKPKTLAELLTEVFSGVSFSMGEGMGNAVLEKEVSGGVEIKT